MRKDPSEKANPHFSVGWCHKGEAIKIASRMLCRRSLRTLLIALDCDSLFNSILLSFFFRCLPYFTGTFMHAKSKSENEKKIEAGEAWANEEKVKELGFCDGLAKN